MFVEEKFQAPDGLRPPPCKVPSMMALEDGVGARSVDSTEAAEKKVKQQLDRLTPERY
jgi:hypothetical protein